jgi:membrane protease YdiL (CAAX protease family)
VRRFGPKQAFGVVGVFFGVQFAFGFVASLISVLASMAKAGWRPGAAPAVSPGILLAAVFGGAIMGSGGAFAVSLISGRDRLRSGARGGFGLVRPAPWTTTAGIVLALGLAAAFVFGVAALVPLDGTEKLGPMAKVATSSPGAKLLWAAFAVLVAPPTEEFVFRGVLLAGLQTRFSDFTAVVIVTALFVLGHVTEAIAYAPAFLAIGALGILTALLRIRFGSLVPSIAAHAAYNFGLCIAMVAGA